MRRMERDSWDTFELCVDVLDFVLAKVGFPLAFLIYLFTQGDKVTSMVFS